MKLSLMLLGSNSSPSQSRVQVKVRLSLELGSPSIYCSFFYLTHLAYFHQIPAKTRSNKILALGIPKPNKLMLLIKIL